MEGPPASTTRACYSGFAKLAIWQSACTALASRPPRSFFGSVGRLAPGAPVRCGAVRCGALIFHFDIVSSPQTRRRAPSDWSRLGRAAFVASWMQIPGCVVCCLESREHGRQWGRRDNELPAPWSVRACVGLTHDMPAADCKSLPGTGCVNEGNDSGAWRIRSSLVRCVVLTRCADKVRAV